MIRHRAIAMDISVRKASGKLEKLNIGKLRASLTRSGADRSQADTIIERMMDDLGPSTSTRKIYKLARSYLRKINRASGLRYSLKMALLRLGPSGYPFEKYFGAVLQSYGYDVRVGVMLEGRCVRHEVDVLAVNHREVKLFECKYRNSPDNTTDVKVAMYVRSRFEDLRWTIEPQYPGKSYSSCLVTNTRFTSDALQYAECSGLEVISWRYPKNSSLEKLIEEKRLYPVTIISGIKTGLIKSLIDQNIILVKDLAGMDAAEIQKMLSLTERKAASLKKQVDELCLC